MTGGQIAVLTGRCCMKSSSASMSSSVRSDGSRSRHSRTVSRTISDYITHRHTRHSYVAVTSQHRNRCATATSNRCCHTETIPYVYILVHVQFTKATFCTLARSPHKSREHDCDQSKIHMCALEITCREIGVQHAKPR